MSFDSLARDLCRDTELLLTHERGFGLTTASPMQRAICRIIDGKPLGELSQLMELRKALGVDPAIIEPRAPKEFAFLSGVRVGKSLISSAVALHWTQVCDVSICGPGDQPRVSILSLDKDKADVVMGHLVGRMKASKYLSSMLISDPSGDEVWVKHPSGLPIEIKVVAGARAGGSLTSRWMAGVIFDEFPRMVGGDEGVVNWTESRNACEQRILPGGGIMDIGSPWAPFGPAYEMVMTSWGKPTTDLVVLKAPAYDINPFWYTPERIEDAKRKPETYITEVEGEFSSGDEQLFPSTWLERSRRAEPHDLPPEHGADYAAAIDPATRGNGWTLVVCTRKGKVRRIAVARQWVGSRADPLSSRETLVQIHELLAPYGLTTVWSDRYYADALREIAGEVGLTLIPTTYTAEEMTKKYLAFRHRLGEGFIEAHPDSVWRTDMQRVRKRVTQQGIQIVLPKTGDGRHCDYAPATILAAARYLDDVIQPPIEADSAEAYRKEVARMKRQDEADIRRPGRLWK